MHRNESQSRRPADRAKDISRLEEIERLRMAQEGIPLPPSPPDAKLLLQYEPRDSRRRMKRLIGIVSSAIDDCIGLILLIALFAFFIGLIIPEQRGGGLNLAIMLAACIVVL